MLDHVLIINKNTSLLRKLYIRIAGLEEPFCSFCEERARLTLKNFCRPCLYLKKLWARFFAVIYLKKS